MRIAERAGLALMHRVEPERAHGLALAALKAGIAPAPGLVTTERLETEVAGLRLPNPLGLAAGFDKNAEAMRGLSRAGFGFLEVGAATPRPQPGNPRPRLFRLSQDRAAINRFGFNNDGMEAIAARLETRPRDSVIGLNLGANKDSDDRASDYVTVLRRTAPLIDFATVNVSSPNTEKLRDLQGRAALEALLGNVIETRDELGARLPVFLKIAPDLDADALRDVAEVARAVKIDGIIATNTTLARDGLTSPHAGQAGGLSGRPLFERSTRILAKLSELTGREIQIIGVGGVENAETAYQKIRAGASALQLYTALVYGGLGLVREILEGLDRRLAADGFSNVAEAVGSGRKSWL
ncbi:dihydroorotate dehydrogenase [Roseivivax halotolerans]|uniref:Dihydroorotate dehydrogenase (quinone) n=1 Tax=Roseivivax halotolerans TaxID=93684 RepID=A0A1I5W825_9RHOB|nr:quinone-dependent dihydroorotate dehydrogenase [Roseivivax halotolerans]SFQ15899.1 dihydroorotate dehydrogenase [Roseivivax halotolerans]